MLIASLAACNGGKPPASLFGPAETRISPEQQQRIDALFADSFPLSDDGTAFEDANCGDVRPVAEVVDLNGDGVSEVFVQWGDTCTSGAAGRSLLLIVAGPNGHYGRQLGFPAYEWTRLDSDTNGWPDLSFGGPGFCHPVWTWRAGSYDFKCNLPEEPGGCDTRANLCPTGG